MIIKFTRTLLFITLVGIYSLSAYANNKPTVNILTWWGYLNHPWVTEEINKNCNVSISYDEFYTSDEFLDRFKTGRGEYDIIIFPTDTYHLLREDIKIENCKLYEQADHYYSAIRKQYFKNHYPHNVVYFSHLVSGVIYNPGKIQVEPTDTLYTLFKKSNTNMVIIEDDPANLYRVVNNFDLNSFKKLLQNTQPIFSNEMSQIVHENEERFAFAYHWSNIALWYIINFNHNFKFIINPKYSYFGADLLAQLNTRANTACVANVLSSKHFLQKMQNTTYNFSPFDDNANITNPYLKKLQKTTYQTLPKLKWDDTLDKNTYYKIHQHWKMIKFGIEHADK
jgi:hypothetical protein